MRLFRVDKGLERAKQESDPVIDKPKTHSIGLHLPDWLYQTIKQDANNLGQRSISGYITLILSKLYQEGREGK